MPLLHSLPPSLTHTHSGAQTHMIGSNLTDWKAQSGQVSTER